LRTDQVQKEYKKLYSPAEKLQYYSSDLFGSKTQALISAKST